MAESEGRMGAKKERGKERRKAGKSEVNGSERAADETGRGFLVETKNAFSII